MLLVRGNQFWFGNRTYRCAIGKGGFSQDKREGDGATPIGHWPLRECWYRPDRLSVPVTKLPRRLITQDDGWCDEPAHAQYNRHVKLPFSASHEKLWREEGVYDVIVPLGYNDAPIQPGMGSAIFLHVAQPDYAPTEGCVALALPDLLEVLAGCGEGDLLRIEPA